MDNPAKGHSIWQFLLKRLVIIIAVVLMCMLAFHTGKRITNCTVMADEAMTARINYAFNMNGILDESSLARYFTPRMINSGKLQTLKEKYTDFLITGYNETASVRWIWSWPGSDTAEVEVTEKVPTISGEAKNREEDPDLTIPAWQDGIYKVSMQRMYVVVNGREVLQWLVDDIEYLEPAPTPTPWPTPSVSPTGTDTSTPTATPTATPTPTDTTTPEVQ